ncbi:MAG: NAD-dependent epimerase/dehydratase family protein, partial [Gemmatales bacterium]|nr:NAD-dependent epimerase/dehydratase family protein [Gemmatales bacterium]
MEPEEDFWRGRLVVLTGATGFLGWHLLQQLRRLGARVRTLALQPPTHHPLLDLDDVETVFGDVCDEALVGLVLRESSIIF